MSSQLSLALSLRDEATFDNFLTPGPSVRGQACQLLQGRLSPGESLAYLWGGRDCGISHILQASCHHYLARGKPVQYLPLGDTIGFDAESLLAGLDQLALVCLQDIHLIEGVAGWEREVFNLFNKMRERKNLLVVTSDRPPRELALALADLKSRLSSGLVYHFKPYSEPEKLEILCFRAARLGLDISEEVAQFIMHRGGRQLEQLMTYLQQLDAASLRAQRRITIPFVKETFGW